MRKLLLLLICSSAFGATVTNMIVSPNGKVQTFNGSSPFGSREIVHTVGGNPVTITATTVLLNTTLYWVDGAPYVASPTGGVELVSFALPDLSVTEPTNSYPAAFAAFSPTVTNTTPHADAPQIAEWTRQNDPGDTMALTAEGVDGATGFFFWAPSTMANGKVQSNDGRAVAVTLPDTLPADDTYLMWIANTNGFSEPVPVNAATMWWVGPDDWYSGDPFSVYGENLTMGTSTSYLYCVEADEWLTSTDANPYKANYLIPADWDAGTYTLYAHNGHGGKYGWSEAATLIVNDPPTWSDDTNTWFNVKSATYGATGNGTTDDYQAILDATLAAHNANGWNTVYFPAGTYAVGYTLTGWRRNIRFLGDGMEQTTITTHADYEENEGDYQSSMWQFLQRDNMFKDLCFANSDGWGQQVAEGQLFHTRGGNRILIDSCKFSSVYEWCEIAKIETDNTVIINSEFPICRPLLFSITENATISNCNFKGVWDANAITVSLNSEKISISDCYYGHYADTNDTSSGLWWGKGRAFATSGSAKNIYFGDNTTSNYQTRGGREDYYYENAVITDIGSQGPVYTDPRSPGTLGVVSERTFTFADLPDEYHERGDYSSDYSGGVVFFTTSDPDKTVGAYVKELNATNDTLTVYIKENQFSKTNLLTVSATTNASFRDLVDANAGEMILFEDQGSGWRGVPVSASSTNVSFSESIGHSGHLMITDGRGAGQYREVTVSGTNAVVDKPWRVVPDSSSVIHRGRWFNQVAIYNNVLDAFDNANYDTASAGFQITGGSHTTIMDGNTVSDQETGVWLHSYQLDPDGNGEALVSPTMFASVKNNGISNSLNGVSCTHNIYSGTDDYADTSGIGIVVRNNVVDDVVRRGSTIGRGLGATTENYHPHSVIWQDNVVSSGTNDLTGLDANSNYQIFIGNTFAGTGSSIEHAAESFSFLDNSFTGYASNYPSFFTKLNTPVQVYFTGETGTCYVQNQGTTNMSWSCPTFSKSGTLGVGASTSFTFSTASATSFDVIGGSSTQTIHVVEE